VLQVLQVASWNGNIRDWPANRNLQAAFRDRGWME